MQHNDHTNINFPATVGFPAIRDLAGPVRNGSHMWRPVKRQSGRVLYCNACERVLIGLNTRIMVCHVCDMHAHNSCIRHMGDTCKPLCCTCPTASEASPAATPTAATTITTTVAAAPRHRRGASKQQQEPLAVTTTSPTHAVSDNGDTDSGREHGQTEHHWVRGNLPSDAACHACGEPCASTFGLIGVRCSWCRFTLHSECIHEMSPVCTLGELATLIAPPCSFVEQEPRRRASSPHTPGAGEPLPAATTAPATTPPATSQTSRFGRLVTRMATYLQRQGWSRTLHRLQRFPRRIRERLRRRLQRVASGRL